MATEENDHASTEGIMANLSIRLLMQGKEVGGVIGKRGEIVNRIRVESGAKVNISDGPCPERILTITGHFESISIVFKLICTKFEEDLGQMNQNNTPLTFRLIVPSSQCGSLIGKGGAKIKDLREVTGASIQVESDMLPNSTERIVTICGTAEVIMQCIYHICCVLLESPPKGPTIPYNPRSYGMHGNYPGPSPSDMLKRNSSPLAGLLGLGAIIGANQAESSTDFSAPVDLKSDSHNQSSTDTESDETLTNEIIVPNELIGCIIGKGGTKIAEMRQMTGAIIAISRYNEGSEDANKQDRTITIKGNEDQVALAKYLVNTSVEAEKVQMEGGKSGASGHVKKPNNIPWAQLLKNPQAANALSSLSGMLGRNSLSPQGIRSNREYQPKHRPSEMHFNYSYPKEYKRNKYSPY